MRFDEHSNTLQNMGVSGLELPPSPMLLRRCALCFEEVLIVYIHSLSQENYYEEQILDLVENGQLKSVAR